MDGILSAIGTETGSDRLGCLSSSVLSVSGSNNLTPLANSILANELHTNHNIAGDELLQVGEERLSLVLAVE